MFNMDMLLIIISCLALVVIILLVLLILRKKKPVEVPKGTISKVKPVIMAPTEKIVNIKYAYSAMKHVGSREEQQDAFAVIDGSSSNITVDFAGILCDGMGGLADGALTSQSAVNSMVRLLNNISGKEETIPRELLSFTKDMANEIVTIAKEKNMLGQMGTTLLAVVFNKGYMYWTSVGDSRIYIFRDNRLIQVNTEHNYRFQLIEEVSKDELLREDALIDKNGEKLISYIGIPELTRIELSFAPFALNKGDKVLLCSDGLYNTLNDNEIAQIMSGTKIKNTASSLIQLTISRKKPHQDNVSIIAIEYRGE